MPSYNKELLKQIKLETPEIIYPKEVLKTIIEDNFLVDNGQRNDHGKAIAAFKITENNIDYIRNIYFYTSFFEEDYSLKTRIYSFLYDINEQRYCLHCGRPVREVAKLRFLSNKLTIDDIFSKYCERNCSKNRMDRIKKN